MAAAESQGQALHFRQSWFLFQYRLCGSPQANPHPPLANCAAIPPLFEVLQYLPPSEVVGSKEFAPVIIAGLPLRLSSGSPAWDNTAYGTPPIWITFVRTSASLPNSRL
jgi:hypothetical protein